MAIINSDTSAQATHHYASSEEPNPTAATSLKLEPYVQEVHEWLFNGQPSTTFPNSKLHGRDKERYAPKLDVNSVRPAINQGPLSGRICVLGGGITDLQSPQGHMVICSSNNGDLLTGCGFAVAKAVINAAGAGLQAELYSRYGVPGLMGTPKYGKTHYGKTEGRGYAIHCQPHDMAASHGVSAIEVLIVPLHSQEGVYNMYREAFEHSVDEQNIVVPMAGATHPVLRGKPDLNAKLAMDAFRDFAKMHPESKLRVIFAIPDSRYQNVYIETAKALSDPTTAATYSAFASNWVGNAESNGVAELLGQIELLQAELLNRSELSANKSSVPLAVGLKHTFHKLAHTKNPDLHHAQAMEKILEPLDGRSADLRNVLNYFLGGQNLQTPELSEIANKVAKQANKHNPSKKGVAESFNLAKRILVEKISKNEPQFAANYLRVMDQHIKAPTTFHGQPIPANMNNQISVEMDAKLRHLTLGDAHQLSTAGPATASALTTDPSSS